MRKKTPKYSEFDSAEYLRNDRMIAEYLAAILEENEPKILPYALGQVARAQGMSELARKTGISRQALYQSLREDGNPSFDTITKILNAYGVELLARKASKKKAA